jgi:hypothetical protein
MYTYIMYTYNYKQIQTIIIHFFGGINYYSFTVIGVMVNRQVSATRCPAEMARPFQLPERPRRFRRRAPGAKLIDQHPRYPGETGIKRNNQPSGGYG